MSCKGESVMTSDEKHAAGHLLLWSGVFLSVLGVLVGIRGFIAIGIGLFALALMVSFFGAWLKKKHCPHCRKGTCEAGLSLSRDQNSEQVRHR